jgi:hypothetical protein
MKRASSVLVGMFVLLTGLLSAAPLQSALAMNNNSSSSNTCSSGFPAPYSGGAPVAKFFHLSDGSTVTITTTGAVIKQSPCATAYREGWVNVSDICNIQSAQDLNGNLSSGSSNPSGSSGFTSCTTTSNQASTPKPAATQTQTQSQSQSITINNPAPAVKAATTTSAQAVTAAPAKTLPNTGPGNILALSGTTTAIGTIGHMIYSRRSRRLP